MKRTVYFIAMTALFASCRTTDGSNPPEQQVLTEELKEMMKDQPDKPYSAEPVAVSSDSAVAPANQEE
jgi:hypothetical protein